MQNKNIKKIEIGAFFYIIGIIIYSLLILKIDYSEYSVKSVYFWGDMAFLFASIYFVALIFLYHILKHPNLKTQIYIWIWTIIGIVTAISLILWMHYGSYKISQSIFCIILMIIQGLVSILAFRKLNRKLKNSKNKTKEDKKSVKTDKFGNKYIYTEELGRKVYLEN